MKTLYKSITMSEPEKIKNVAPLSISVSGYMYYVASGSIHICAIRKHPDGKSGNRIYITTFSEGEFFFPLPAIKETEFIVTGTQNASIASIRYSDIEKQYAAASNGTDNKEMIQQARNALSNWLRHFPSFDDTRQEEDTCIESVTARYRKTAEKLSEHLYEKIQQDIIAESNRLIKKSQLSNNEFVSTIQKIGILLEKKKDNSIDFSGTPEESLFKAAKKAAAGMNIALISAENKVYKINENGIDEIAKDNNIRIREIILENDWQKKESGSILGFYSDTAETFDPESNSKFPEDVQPVALIPGKNGYTAFNPVSGISVRITKENAGKFLPTAYQFYRPLPDKKLSLKDIISFCMKDGTGHDIATYVIFGIITALVGLILPEMTRIFTDTVIPEAAKNMMVQLAMLMFLCTCSSCLFGLTKNIAMIRLQTKTSLSLQAAVMDRVMKMPAPFFRKYSSGDMAERTMGITSIYEAISGSTLTSIMGFIFSLVYLFQMFRYNSILARWGILFVACTVVFISIGMLIQYKYEKTVVNIQGGIMGRLLQFMMGVDKINTTASEQRAFSVWAKDFISQKKMSLKAGHVSNVINTFITVFPLLTSMFFYLIYMHSVSKDAANSISTGSFLAFISAYTTFQASFLEITCSITGSIGIIPLYKRIKPILETETEVRETKQLAPKLKGNIEVIGVTFRYAPDGPEILKDVSLSVKPGEFVAIVGPSGSGKSTLLRLLLGFEKPESGSVYYDNQDIDSFDIASLRRQMGVVMQNGSLMQGSIYKNIVGSSTLTIDDAWNAAEMVGLADDIRAMPMGMHTMIPAGGTTISGGQRQRLIIARSIVRRPSILLFDEATSALDNRTQAMVTESLNNLKVTRIVIAHRLSTIMNADTIYVLERGKIVESGSYSELMNKQGTFYNLAIRQQV